MFYVILKGSVLCLVPNDYFSKLSTTEEDEVNKLNEKSE